MTDQRRDRLKQRLFQLVEEMDVADNPLLQSSYWEQGVNGEMDHYTITVGGVVFQVVDHVNDIEEFDIVDQNIIGEQDNYHDYEKLRENIYYAKGKYRWIGYALGVGKLLTWFI